ncbi:MAG TPA: AAA family ATPase [Leptospiraceae bacterium]|nr:AAA family ATPase [Leptospiraceae bacterium]HMW05237.1 AAA family ATPase [Leptospiraceae bacterium]HMX31298.1 AAA family ATPase [Leptospiraceae bacterium]HMY32104.1 AAA family ATPase [Leptospiraceae bacterium]HMZ64679.1 AAA family ATPase [Leptospiraceae bacterium]
MKNTRGLSEQIKTDLETKMVFLGGPRQVGKTTLAKSFIKSEKQYLNWDFLEDRKIIKDHKIDPNLKLIVLDEVHKYVRWRTLVKGFYDKYKESLSILVTGSARLDHFRKGGDSLQGRYHYLRLHPFSLYEVDPKLKRSTTLDLLRYGGFPEPFIKKDDTFYRRWQKERIAKVIYEDLRDLENVKELSLLELLVDALPSKVGSVLSMNALREDLEISPNTVAHWIQILDTIYYCYRIPPFGAPKIRAVKKSNKLYLWDWAEVENQGARFENMVASHLLKFCHYQEDSQGYKMELRFIRDTDLREIDFVVIRNRKPLFAVECKTGENNISPHIKYFRDRTDIPIFYQIHLGSKEFIDKNIHVLPFESFCKKEKMV